MLFICCFVELFITKWHQLVKILSNSPKNNKNLQPSTNKRINASTVQSAHKHINLEMHQHINTSTHQQLKSSIKEHTRILLILVLISALTSSCVVNKRYQYLQNDDVNLKSNEALKDTVLRTYNLSNFEYKLQPEDIISVKFLSLTPQEYDFFSIKGGQGANNFNQFQNPVAALVNGYLIDEEGQVEFPVVGKVNISGLTVFQAQKEILNIAKEYLKDPVIEVRLLNFRFTLLGEVKKEGTINSLNNRITMLEAIGLAGGVTDFADKSNIKIIRQGKGVAEVYYLNLLDENFIKSPFYYINQNDVIVVPPLKQRPFQIYFAKNLSLVISTISLLVIAINFTK